MLSCYNKAVRYLKLHQFSLLSRDVVSCKFLSQLSNIEIFNGDDNDDRNLLGEVRQIFNFPVTAFPLQPLLFAAQCSQLMFDDVVHDDDDDNDFDDDDDDNNFEDVDDDDEHDDGRLLTNT